MIMKQMSKRKMIAVGLTGNILPSVVRALNAKSRGLNYEITRSGLHDAEVKVFDVRQRKELTFAVFSEKKECTCRQWQISGKPCLHAIALICALRGVSMENYVHEFFSVKRFQLAYESSIAPMSDKSQWPKIDPGYTMLPPKLGRRAGRPPTKRIPNSGEGKGRKGRAKCKRCGGFGHFSKTCTQPEWVDPTDPDNIAAAPKAKKRKPKTKATFGYSQENVAGASSSQPVQLSKKNKQSSSSQPIPRKTPPRLAKQRASATGASNAAATRKRNLLDMLTN